MRFCRGHPPLLIPALVPPVEVRITVPFFLWSVLVGEPSARKGERALLGNLDD